MDESTEVTLKCKFNIAYFTAKEKLAFTKMKPLCELEERHGIDLGARYKNDIACSTFVSYIAAEVWHNLLETLSKVNFSVYKQMAVQILRMLKMIISRIKKDRIEQAEITNYDGAITFLRSHQAEYMEAAQNCLRDWLKLQHADVLTHSLTILATYGWKKDEDGSFAHTALESLSTRFRAPLEKVGVGSSLIQQEREDIIDYVKHYST